MHQFSQNTRADILLPQATKLTLFVLCESNLKDTIEQYKTAFSQLTKADQIHYLAPNTSYDEPHLRVDTASATLLISPLKGLTGLDLAIAGSQKKIKNLESSISKTEGKLSSQKFKEKAPELAKEAEDNHMLKTQHQRLSDHLKQLMAYSD